MQRGFRSLKDCVFHNPLGLSCLPSKTRQLSNWYLPRDTGIEFEIQGISDSREFDLMKREITRLNLKTVGASYQEQSFRICSGEEGMIQLYKLSHILKKYYSLNPCSGIHYHTSCPKVCDITTASIPKFRERFLKELDTWGYEGNYNARAIGIMQKSSWVNMRWDFDTIEYRIGEMTFDYDLLIKRIVHCHAITRKIENCIKTLPITKVKKDGSSLINTALHSFGVNSIFVTGNVLIHSDNTPDSNRGVILHNTALPNF
jgi:hypothetical protein